MQRRLTCLLLVLITGVLVSPSFADGREGSDDSRRGSRFTSQVRVATFNASLNRNAEGQLVADLSSSSNAQAQTIAEIIQRVRPDILLINEFDFDVASDAVRLFQDNYFSLPQNGAQPIQYPYVFVAPSNTGIPSGFDLDNNGVVGGPNDTLGFGAYPGQFGMVVYSRWPILKDKVRTFQNFRWVDMPGAHLPDDLATLEVGDWYSEAELAIFPLSSKSHWDVPIMIGGRVLHLLASHPTPPVFDGAEDRNGLRNFDEIGFWADYVTPGKTSRYIYDDQGQRGGLRGEYFIVVGDQNSDPLDGHSVPGAIQQLLDHPRINASHTPSSRGAVEAADRQGGANDTHRSDSHFDTADFADTVPGNLRADYVLPSCTFRIEDSGVFWPRQDDPLFRLVGEFPFPGSDHRLVWVDLEFERSNRSCSRALR